MSTTSLRGRDLISAADLSAAEVGALFALATQLKAEYAVDRRHAEPPLARRTVAMLFQRPSLRTRVTFEAGSAPRRGDHVRRDGRSEEHHLRSVGEPAARAEGPAGRAAGRLASPDPAEATTS